MDYLQLVRPNISIFTLKKKNLQDSKTSFKDPEKDLFCKIVMGDKSDNIPGVFPKCGIKSAEKYYNDNNMFMQKVTNDEEAYKRFQINYKIIDFSNIPEELSSELMSNELFKQH